MEALLLSLAAVLALAQMGLRFGAALFGGTILRFEKGKLVSLRGKLHPRVKEEFCEIARMRRLSGRVTVPRRGKPRYSDGIPADIRQAFQNVFYMYY